MVTYTPPAGTRNVFETRSDPHLGRFDQNIKLIPDGGVPNLYRAEYAFYPLCLRTVSTRLNRGLIGGE